MPSASEAVGIGEGFGKAAKRRPKLASSKVEWNHFQRETESAPKCSGIKNTKPAKKVTFAEHRD